MFRLARHAPDYARHILGSYPSSRRHESGGCGASTTSEGSSHSKSPERHERGWKEARQYLIGCSSALRWPCWLGDVVADWIGANEKADNVEVAPGDVRGMDT